MQEMGQKYKYVFLDEKIISYKKRGFFFKNNRLIKEYPIFKRNENTSNPFRTQFICMEQYLFIGDIFVINKQYF